MPEPVPNSEPQSFTAGQTLSWNKVLPLYPSTGGYTLKYALQAANQTLITITATGNPDDSYSISVPAATTTNYAPGVYVWTAYVEYSAGIRDLVCRGTISVLASPLAALTTSVSAQILALIEAAILNRIPNGLESTEIDGQRLDRIPLADLIRMRKEYQSKVRMESDAASAALGFRKNRTIGIRFINPRSPAIPGNVPHSL